MERLDLTRYTILLGAVLAAFLNLMDALSTGATLLHIFMYSGTLLIMAIILIFTNTKWVLVSILFSAGVLTLLGDEYPIGLSSAMLFFGYATYIARNRRFNYITYFVVSLIVATTYAFNGCNPKELVTVFLGYGVCFLLNESIYGGR